MRRAYSRIPKSDVMFLSHNIALHHMVSITLQNESHRAHYIALHHIDHIALNHITHIASHHIALQCVTLYSYTCAASCASGSCACSTGVIAAQTQALPIHGNKGCRAEDRWSVTP